VNTVLLTTDTTHHRYFAKAIAERHTLCGILVETSCPAPAFETVHPFEQVRDEYERDILLRGAPCPFEAVTSAKSVHNVNDGETLSALRTWQADVVIVFGAGRLGLPVIQSARHACLNLHGGNPEEYRGLDSHLWTIYHRDFANLVTTLHYVDQSLDTGAIVGQERLNVAHTGLHELRTLNTRACVRLTQTALEALEAGGFLPSRPQARQGRYYSFMPRVLKDIGLKYFEHYVRQL
jgi:methionyl-tRNA formyltransferase